MAPIRHKISVSSLKKNGRRAWRVRWRDVDGKIRRAFFSEKIAAEAEAVRLRGEQVSINQQWIAMSPEDRERLMMAWREAKTRGVDLFEAVVACKVDAAAMPAATALAAMIAEKKASGLRPEYLKILKLVCDEFIRGREQLEISKFTVLDVKQFLARKKLNYRPTVRSRLSALFGYAMRAGWRRDNPCQYLERIKVPRGLPAIFTPAQVRKCVAYFKKRPRGMAWFGLTTFCGLRPSEAQRCDKAALQLDGRAPFVNVTPAIARKTGQWRIVYIKPEAAAFLKLAVKRKAELPLRNQPKRRVVLALRKLLGLERWPKDLTRHSAASYWLADCRDPAHVAESLGHAERILRAHYKHPIPKTVAKQFWAAANPK